MTFVSLTLTPFCSEKSCVRKGVCKVVVDSNLQVCFVFLKSL